MHGNCVWALHELVIAGALRLWLPDEYDVRCVSAFSLSMCLYVDSEDFVYRNKIMEQHNNMEQQQYKCKTHIHNFRF